MYKMILCMTKQTIWDPDQDPQNVGPDLDQNCFQLLK